MSFVSPCPANPTTVQERTFLSGPAVFGATAAIRGKHSVPKRTHHPKCNGGILSIQEGVSRFRTGFDSDQSGHEPPVPPPLWGRLWNGTQSVDPRVFAEGFPENKNRWPPPSVFLMEEAKIENGGFPCPERVYTGWNFRPKGELQGVFERILHDRHAQAPRTGEKSRLKLAGDLWDETSGAEYSTGGRLILLICERFPILALRRDHGAIGAESGGLFLTSLRNRTLAMRFSGSGSPPCSNQVCEGTPQFECSRRRGFGPPCPVLRKTLDALWIREHQLRSRMGIMDLFNSRPKREFVCQFDLSPPMNRSSAQWFPGP